MSSGRLAEMQDSCKRERVRADSLERAVFCSFDYSGFFCCREHIEHLKTL